MREQPLQVSISVARNIILVCTIFILIAPQLFSQQSALGADSLSANVQIDVHSSLIWRGVALERNPVMQAAFVLHYDQFQAAFYGTQTFGGGFNATLLQVQYSIASAWGTFTPTLTDYYFPGNRLPFFSFANDGTGAHTLEAALTYQAPKAVPVRIFAAINIFNDPRFSAYSEAAYSFSIGTIEVSAFLGVLLTPRSAWYSSPHSPVVQHIGINALGFRASYAVQITDKWSLPIAASFVLNPNAGYAYAVASISFR
jgi:hypothetical protein